MAEAVESQGQELAEQERIVEKVISNRWLFPVFQPVVSLSDGGITGYEALTRMKQESGCTEKLSIEQLFYCAEVSGQIWKLDYLCRKNAIKQFYESSEAKCDKRLFLNVCPSIMLDRRFKAGFTKEYLERYKADPDSIVFEITEREAVRDSEEFKELVNHYKEQGFKTAIDDVGAGYSGLKRIVDVVPQFIKLDISLIRDIHLNPVSASIVKSMTAFANENGIRLIAEGIETREELEKVIQLGVHYGQGYYLAYPSKEILPLRDDIREEIYDINNKKHGTGQYAVNRCHIKNVCTPVFTVEPEKMVIEVMEHLQNHPDMPGVCVCSDNKAVGILTREQMFRTLGARYGFSLYENKPISSIMNREFLSVDYETSIQTVSELAMHRENAKLYDFIEVSGQGRHYGIVTIKDLLVKATQLNVLAAKSENPLTGLPGNVIIEQEMENCIKTGEVYSVYYLDLDNFKAYNDIYGFENGDKIICALAETLCEVVNKEGFIGHIGGDDFVLIVRGEYPAGNIRMIEEKFAEKIRPLYSEADLKRGYIEAVNRQGEYDRFPIVTVTTVGITNKGRKYNSQYEMSEELALLKKKEKRLKQEHFREERLKA